MMTTDPAEIRVEAARKAVRDLKQQERHALARLRAAAGTTLKTRTRREADLAAVRVALVAATREYMAADAALDA